MQNLDLNCDTIVSGDEIRSFIDRFADANKDNSWSSPHREYNDETLNTLACAVKGDRSSFISIYALRDYFYDLAEQIGNNDDDRKKEFREDMHNFANDVYKESDIRQELMTPILKRNLNNKCQRVRKNKKNKKSKKRR